MIDMVGHGVSESRLGERVWTYEAQVGRPFGTAAEYVVVPSVQAVRLPDTTDFAEGACLGVPAMTAHRCVFADGPVNGQTVLVAGARVRSVTTPSSSPSGAERPSSTL